MKWMTWHHTVNTTLALRTAASHGAAHFGAKLCFHVPASLNLFHSTLVRLSCGLGIGNGFAACGAAPSLSSKSTGETFKVPV